MINSISHTKSSGWINLDAWSETYIGAYWLVRNELPAYQYQADVHHGPLSQMVLLASHQLVEIIFFQCVRSIFENNPGNFLKIEKSYSRASFGRALEEWPEILTGVPLDLTKEPLNSVCRLKNRRNATVHKNSALTSLEMARSALFSAVEASKLIAEHFMGDNGFKYESVLKKYPLQKEQWFGQVQFIDEVT
ncbi:hypothetical protein H1S06_13125 [Marinobacterium sp. 3-1745]|uniref:Uncharacterized protein n=2 Tax=Marinobacterium marinum TaxID=2756129 RepID=A0A7W1WZZ0_9GAMM|nr:hypothetical protein [Marinobacterium marinum]